MLLMRIVRAGSADLPEVERLLVAGALPLEGVREAFATGVVARRGPAVVGAAAVEPYGPHGLLRSVVVSPAERGRGIGRRLVQASEGLARELGVEDLYLLTETARDWFDRLGYQRLPRESVPADVQASLEFTTACPQTAVAMHRALGPNGSRER